MKKRPRGNAPQPQPEQPPTDRIAVQIGYAIYDITAPVTDLIILDRMTATDDPAYLGEPIAIEIGQMLHNAGGMTLMQAVAQFCPPARQRELELAWDGIGEWLA